MSRKEYGSARATIEGSGEWRSGAGGRWSAGLGDTRYLCLVNNHARYARSHYAKEVSDTSLSMKNVSRAVIYDLPIPLLAEQHRIVAKVDELLALFDSLEAQIVEHETKSSVLLDALLHEALASPHPQRPIGLPGDTASSRVRPSARSGPSCLVHLGHLPHDLRPEPLLRLVGIVRAAPQLEVGHVCSTAFSERDKVVQLQETALGAAARGADECTPPFIPPPDFPFHGSRYVTRTAPLPTGRTRMLNSRELLAF